MLGLVEATYPQLVMGATVPVETVHGPVPLELPPGTQPGEEFRLAERANQITGYENPIALDTLAASYAVRTAETPNV